MWGPAPDNSALDSALFRGTGLRESTCLVRVSCWLVQPEESGGSNRLVTTVKPTPLEEKLALAVELDRRNGRLRGLKPRQWTYLGERQSIHCRVPTMIAGRLRGVADELDMSVAILWGG